jgi:glycosyltransferase involved in cell wall biosynthesis
VPAGRLRVAVTVEQSWQPVPGGTATSTVELLRELGADPGLRLTGVAAAHRRPPPKDVAPPVRVAHLPLPRALLYEAWHRFRRPAVTRATGPVDVVHATSWAIPPRSAPLVVTVHDLAFLHEPSHFTARGVRFFRRGLALTSDEADAVVVPSEATLRDCLKAGLPPHRLHVVPHGTRPWVVEESAVQRFRQRHGLQRPYVLWCGTIEPRKNLPVLLRAFARLVRTSGDLDLVLVGPSGWGEVDTGAAPGLPRDRVRMLGYLGAADLHAAYAGARAFCYPSLREGFGLPVLEAMSHGVPVVTSEGTATAEVAHGAGIIVDAHDDHALAAALAEAVGARHDQMATRSASRAAGYSWARSAAALAAVYRCAAGAGG